MEQSSAFTNPFEHRQRIRQYVLTGNLQSTDGSSLQKPSDDMLAELRRFREENARLRESAE